MDKWVVDQLVMLALPYGAPFVSKLMKREGFVITPGDI